ncbi:cytochrome c oxidase accessory protein CcoG [Devosia sp. ZB163]|uniref:cytochrome c oxidase accessory protein CcoG n=1 Tax=Devosia sp. ZB163 TaxID=3025938 RepID=UPI002360E6DE|nr:cytochrome c oxidase accessory protein CcoG [Devosia sp. ZB163]MDC9823786.1 cytochrome c oxidase accessory protein CcoG [Devosia sp. ZB163]
MTTHTPDTQTYDVEAVNAAGRRQPLYAPRKKIFPKRASGRFRKFKWLVMLITLTIYYVTPWLRWDRGPFAPDQAVLVDLANRRFYFFFIEIWPQEFYYVAGMLVMAGIGLFLVTSTVGRAWCGYACPQTVWVDLFLAVERFIEGDRNARIKLDAGKWTADKLMKRTAKHATWLVIGILTGGAWIFYFADAPTLLADVVTLQAPLVAYATIALLTATTYTFGGLLREQVCTYMCPWPRIQGAMLDEHSLTVTYNDWRGEPRSRHAKRAAAEGKPVGDCVDCNACVVVCPMGIDIRDGQQLECITCALCIDACDDVMTRLGKEQGLISYATLSDYNRNMALATGSGKVVQPSRVRNPVTGKLVDAIKRTNWRSVIHPRTIVYLVGWIAIGLAMVTALALRTPLSLNVLHDRNPLYVELRDGSVRNGYDVKVLNMAPEMREVELRLDGLPGSTISLVDGGSETAGSLTFTLEPDKVLPVRLYVRVGPESLPASQMPFQIVVSDEAAGITRSVESTFEVPEKRK